MATDGRLDKLRAQVGAAGFDDVGEPRARLSRTTFAALGLEEGEPVRLSAGHESALLRAYPAGPEDDGLDLVRLDDAQRRRLGVGVGETVQVERYEGRTATRIRLVALGDLPRVDIELDEVRRALAERPVTVGDTILVSPGRRVFDAQLNLLGLTLGGITGSLASTDDVLLRVADTLPSGVVRVSDATQIEIVHAEAAMSDDGETTA
jgi:transitional endoplasmic reticulum ATPase